MHSASGIQAAAPVDSFVTPEPWAMPGYDSDVIMAAGAFVQGSSIELSADGPIKPPYAVYLPGRTDLVSCQGGNPLFGPEAAGGRRDPTVKSGIRRKMSDSWDFLKIFFFGVQEIEFVLN